MYVYYEEPVAILNYGADDEQNEFLVKADFLNLKGKLLVSVKDGSLIPKDPLTEANQAVDLYEAGALDLLTLLEKLDIENAKEVATRTMLFKSDPQAYLSQVLGYSSPEQQAPQSGQGSVAPAGRANPQEVVVPKSALPAQPDVLSQVPIQ